MNATRPAWIVILWLVGSLLWAQSPNSKSEKSDPDKPRATPQARPAAPRPPAKIIRSEREWRKLLTREQYRVLRQRGTERPFRNKYDKHFEPGTYACAACGLELFASDTKFNSGCGWPAFYAAKAGDRVLLRPDLSLGMLRTEVICARCNSHLGHIFRDAPRTPTGNRFCINSVSLKFIPADKAKPSDKKQATPTPSRSTPSSSSSDDASPGD